MSLTKLFLTIEKTAIGRFFERKRNLIEKLDPDRIYIENVRTIFNVPTFAAKFFCEMAVIEGIFSKHYGIECKNNGCERIILSVSNKKEVPEKIKCLNCEILEEQQFEFLISELYVKPYYKLTK